MATSNFVDSDWTITRSTGAVRYIGDDHTGSSPSYVSVEDFHIALQEFAYQAVSSGDDELDITDLTPSEKFTSSFIELINNYNIDATAAEHIFGGTIVQDGGNTIFDGLRNFGNTPKLQLIQNGAVLSDDWWNVDSEGTGLGINSDVSAGISHQFMILVRSGGTDIDGRRLIGTTRNYGKRYSEFSINGTSRGNNVLALSEANDLNNATPEGTVAGYTDIVNTNEGYIEIDVTAPGSAEPFYSAFTIGSRQKNDLYERGKWLTRDGSSETLYGLPGELFRGITHTIDIDSPSGTFQEPEEVSWTSGTGQLLAIDSTTAGTKMYIQLLTGVPPSDNDTITGADSSATADVDVNVVAEAISTPFVGVSTGSAIIGGFGFGIISTDLSANDRLLDLDGNTLAPPNNATYSVNGLVVGEDFVVVYPENSSLPDKSQLSLDTALTTNNITLVTVDTTIPGDTPTSGVIRVVDNDGTSRRLVYTSYNGDEFTIDPSASESAYPPVTNNVADFGTINADAGNDVYIGYIDKLATATSETFTAVYQGSDRSLFIRVRDGGSTPIKTFETTGSFTSAGGSTTVIRTSDA